MNQSDLAILLNCPLFDGEDDMGLARDLETLPYRMTSVNDGQFVLIRNDSYDDLIVIVAGVLQAFQEDRIGHHLIVESLRAPEAVATSILFSPDSKIPVSLKADGPCRLFSISRHSILRLCSRYPGILANLLRDMGARTAFLADKLRYQAFASIRQKLAVFLLEKIDEGKDTITVNKEKLAEMFGVNRPSLSRVCHEMTKSGFLRLEGRKLIIMDSGMIRNLVENLDDL